MDQRPECLRIYRSNRMEKLAESLGDVLSEPPENPLSPECILVPGRGVAQWLNMQLCERFGIWANVLYLYPRNFVGWALDRVLGKPGEALEVIEPERLLWSVFSTLKPLLGRPEFETVQRYVAADSTEVRYFELCRRIAFTFDRYATYRPDMLHGWERPSRGSSDAQGAPQLALFSGSQDTQGWQPVLWRALSERLGPVHTGALERRFLRSLQQNKRSTNLPGRISCVGVTHLPPSYTRILVALCRQVPVHMFQLCASEGASSAALPAPRGRSRGAAPRTATFREARQNPLVQSLGALATEFESILGQELESQGVTSETAALFEGGVESTRLTRLQREILENRAPSPGPPLIPGSPADESIRIHVCHSPMREVEVVHDQLMALLSSDAGLEPRDVVVMMPDVESYAPLIEAVFRRGSDDAYRVPYSIADRTVQTSAPVVDALERLFALGDQRLSAPQVLDLLALDVVAARFEITPQDLELATHWLTSTNVRWGIDAAHKDAHGHPRHDQNSWRLGLRRLFLGYALDTEEPGLVFDTLPAEGAEGTLAATLGRLSAFVETLFQHVAALAAPHPPEEWPTVVGAALEALCVSDEETAWQHQQLREALTLLQSRAAAAGYTEPIGGAALREILFEAVNSALPARGFLMGGVTFCSMVPLRTIPFRVVCMLGLGDGQLPRRELSTDFDLITHGPEGRRLGDRSRRSEDRYLFLEAILSARERLLITYTGQSIRDNAPLPPSVLVNELCDYLAASAPASVPRGLALEDIIVHHPLQAFSPRYFDKSDARLFSYAAHYVEGVEPRGPARVVATEFFPGPLPAEEQGSVLATQDLVRFYQNPAAYLLNRRLELFLREQDLEVPDREPQEISPLDKYTTGHQLLELLLSGVDAEQAKPIIRATGALPLGGPGDLDFMEIAACASGIAERVLEARRGGRRPPLHIEHALPSGRQLSGTLPESFGNGLLEYQFSRVRAKHLLGTWIRHLLYCWRAPGESASESSLIGRALSGNAVTHRRFLPVSDPARHLDALVARYDEGQTHPLCLFPSTSLLYAEEQRKKPKPESELKLSLEREWRAELGRDPHLVRIYGSHRPLSELEAGNPSPRAFEALALEVFAPLLDHLVAVEKDR